VGLGERAAVRRVDPRVARGAPDAGRDAADRDARVRDVQRDGVEHGVGAGGPGEPQLLDRSARLQALRDGGLGREVLRVLAGVAAAARGQAVQRAITPAALVLAVAVDAREAGVAARAQVVPARVEAGVAAGAARARDARARGVARRAHGAALDLIGERLARVRRGQ